MLKRVVTVPHKIMKGVILISRIIRKDSVAIKILFHLSWLHEVWKKDLKLYASKITDRKNAEDAYKKLMDQQLIKENDIASSPVTVRITRKGNLYLADRGYPVVLRKNEEKPFRTVNAKTIHKELTKNKAITLFRSAGVSALPIEKPSFGNLLNSFTPLFKVEKDDGSRYKNISGEEIRKQLSSTGYYYSAMEFRTFLNAQGTAMSDSIRGSRFSGIYLRRNECCVVYCANPGENRMLKISHPLEQRLVDLLGKYITSSLAFNVFRNVYSEPHRINAIVISDGYAMVYKMAMDNHKGHTTGNLADIKRNEQYWRNPGKHKFSIFRFDQDLYGKVFVIPTNSYGADSLYYLSRRDAEQFITDGAMFSKQFDSVLPVEIPNQSGQAVCKTTGLPLIYMPVYEVMTLYRASIPDYSGSAETGFIAPAWMHKTIRHCVRMNIPIYDSETGNPDYSGIRYSEDGYIEGTEISKKNKKRFRRKRTSISCAQNTYTILADAARAANMSFSSYLVRAAIEKARGDEAHD